MKYIDIHTHNSIGDNEVIAIRNYIWGEQSVPDTGFYSVGIHPWFIHKFSDQSLQAFEKQLQHKNCMAIGECGLDFQKNILQQHAGDMQIAYFKRQIDWAYQYQKPLMIHCVKCFDKLLQLKKQYPDTIPWIIHGFAKNKDLAVQLIDAGFYLSFGSALLKSQTNRLALKHVPLNKVFLETDEEPNSIKEIYSAAASFLQISIKELQGHVADNFKRVF